MVKLDYAVENAKLNQQLIPKGSETANSSWTSPLSWTGLSNQEIIQVH